MLRVACFRLLQVLQVLCVFTFLSLHVWGQEDHFVKAHGVKLHYVSYGDQQQTVVLVHGWACDNEFWREQIPALSPHWRVIAVDLPGFGKSDKPHVAYTPQYFSDALYAMLSDAHATHIYLVGHSMGGTVVRQYTHDHPSTVAALVIVDSRSLLQGEDLGRPYPERKHLVDELYGPDEQESARKDIMRMFTDQTSPALQQEILHKMLATPAYVAASAMQGLLTPVKWSQDPTQLPTLALYRSPVSNDALHALHTMFPHLQFKLYPGAGHFLMLEQPQDFNQQLVQFFDQQTPHLNP